MSNEDELDKAFRETAKYLYPIKGDVSPEIGKAIATLRQLINEEFLHKDKSVSSQFIYDIINPAINALVANKVREARIEEVTQAIRYEDSFIRGSKVAKLNPITRHEHRLNAIKEES